MLLRSFSPCKLSLEPSQEHYYLSRLYFFNGVRYPSRFSLILCKLSLELTEEYQSICSLSLSLSLSLSCVSVLIYIQLLMLSVRELANAWLLNFVAACTSRKPRFSTFKGLLAVSFAEHSHAESSSGFFD